MPTDPQPEEATTKPVAAAAGFAGSLAQTLTYGRGARVRADTTGSRQPGQQRPTEQDRSQTDAAAAEHGIPPEHAAGQQTSGTYVSEQAVGRLDRPLDDPTVEAELLFNGLAGSGTPTTNAATGLTLPAVSSDLIVAASAQDAAAAQLRMALSQLPEPPSVVPPAPGLGPAL
jgi:hypothetical protein